MDSDSVTRWNGPVVVWMRFSVVWPAHPLVAHDGYELADSVIEAYASMDRNGEVPASTSPEPT